MADEEKVQGAGEVSPAEKPKKRGKPSEIMVNHEFCKGCWVCIKHCPTNVFDISKTMSAKGYFPPDVSRPDDCISCWLCEMLCPDFAIWLKRK